jgi:hypothetical protein
MAEAIWYYAVDDQEHGPITSAQLKSLAEAGKLKPDDLVWREGLDDWKPAREVSGLFAAGQKTTPRTTEPAPPPPSAASPITAPAPSPAPSPAASPAEKPAAVPKLESVGLDASMPSPGPRRPTDGTPNAFSPASQPRPAAPSPSSPMLMSLLQPLAFGRYAGQPLMLVGLVLVLLAKGCDSVGNRYVQQLEAKLQLRQNEFQDKCDADRRKIQRQIEALREAGTDTEGEQAELSGLNEQLRVLEDQIENDREKLTVGEWQDLKKKGRDASAGTKVWGYYREAIFVFGTILLTIGLLAVGFTGEGAQRWICLIMLAIITFSLYVGGVAWIGALTNLMR